MVRARLALEAVARFHREDQRVEGGVLAGGLAFEDGAQVAQADRDQPAVGGTEGPVEAQLDAEADVVVEDELVGASRTSVRKITSSK